MNERPLSPKQLEFLKKYVEYKNATKAYKEVYKVTLDSTAQSNASKLLADPRCLKFMEDVKEKAIEESAKSLTDVIGEIEKIAFSNPNEVVKIDDKGRIRIQEGADITKLDGVSISTSESYSKDGSAKAQSISVKQSDKLKALVELAKLKGGYKDDAGNDNRRSIEDSHRRVLSALRKFRKPTTPNKE